MGPHLVCFGYPTLTHLTGAPLSVCQWWFPRGASVQAELKSQFCWGNHLRQKYHRFRHVRPAWNPSVSKSIFSTILVATTFPPFFVGYNGYKLQPTCPQFSVCVGSNHRKSDIFWKLLVHTFSFVRFVVWSCKHVSSGIFGGFLKWGYPQ